ncbi:MAG: PP2C family protein-serine/threonine phosphatase [Bdellovibrionales bacterium]
MNNKTLRRILTKTFGTNSREELSAALTEMGAKISDAEALEKFHGFQENLGNFFDMLDKAVTDLDRVIDIRDRSLAISSQEMVALNKQISEQAREQQSVLDQLQVTLRLLRAGREIGAEAEGNDLGVLMQTVSTLVKSQLNSAQDLKTLFEEGLRVSSVMSFKALETQLDISIDKIVGTEVGVKMYFDGQLFGRPEHNEFFSCNDRNEAAEKLDMNSITPSSGTHFQNIHSTKGAGVLALVQLIFSKGDDSELLLAKIQPLLPNVAATLENVRLLQEEKRKQRMESELQTARFVQQALLPPSAPDVKGTELEISGYYQNASECGGDWWSYFQLADGRHIILVGDVTGHGTGSAMVCAVVKGYCDSFVSRSGLQLSTILEELNRTVYRINREAGRAMTMAAVSIDMKQQKVTFANAGHPHPILIRASERGKPSRPIEYLICSGSILGLSPDVTYCEKTFEFQSGDQIMLYSDGLTEYVSRNKMMYGDQRLKRFLAAASTDFSAAELNRAVIRDLREFALGEEPLDDITSVVVKGF